MAKNKLGDQQIPPPQSHTPATQGTISYPWDVRFLKDKRGSSENTLNINKAQS